MTANVQQSSSGDDRPSSVSCLVVAKPSAATRTAVRSLAWWKAPDALPTRRRVFPEPVLPIIIDLAGPGWFLERPDGVRGPQAASMGVGLHQRYGVLNAPEKPFCLQLQLAPLGAYQVFGVPLHELSDETFDVVDLLGAEVHLLRERLRSLSEPQIALRLLDKFIAQRVQRGREPSPAITWAWHQLLASSGTVLVDELARRIGWSRKHLRQRFLEQVGASPKAAAQLVRFSAAARRLRAAGLGAPLASLAAELGYADQAHMCRAFRHHAGCTPTEFRGLIDPTDVARPESVHG